MLQLFGQTILPQIQSESKWPSSYHCRGTVAILSLINNLYNYVLDF
jgi:hypothetical protein